MANIREDIISKMQTLENLPVLEGVLLEIRQKLCTKNVDTPSAKEVVRLLEKDIGISAKLLKIANSVFYNRAFGDVGDLTTAVTRIGYDEICKICMTLAMLRMFPGASNLISLKEFWKHSIAVGMTCRSISLSSGIKNEYESNMYMAGLMHDVGILILDRYFPVEYSKVRKDDSGDLSERELDILGIDHGEIGALLVEKWKMPESIVEAVRYHHHPDFAKKEYLTCTQILHISDFSCSALGLLEPGSPMPTECSNGAWNDLKISTNDIVTLVKKVEKEIEGSDSFIEIGL